MDCVDGCNVCMHGECYACMVGVATGPESHDTCCSARSVTFTEDGLTAIQHGPAVHRVHVELLTGDPVRWGCWCGQSGQCAPDEVESRAAVHVRDGGTLLFPANPFV
jgi:hypothetical protein